MDVSLARAAQYVGLVFLMAWPIFELLVIRPAAQAATVPAESVARSTRAVFRRLTPLATLLLLGGLVADVILRIQAARFPDQSISDAAWLYLTSTRYGEFAALRLVLAIGIAWTTRAFVLRSDAGSGLGTVGLGLGAMATFSVSGHAASQGTAATQAFDWLHGGAVMIWAAGLLSFALFRASDLAALTGQEQRACVAAMARRFSMMALAAVAALGVTGILLAQRNIYGPEALWESPYGQPLGIKLVLTAVALAAASVNLLLIRPLLSDEARKASARFTRVTSALRALVRVEALCVLAALVAAGVLTNQTPTPEWGELSTRVTQDVEFGATRATVTLAPSAPRMVRVAILPRLQSHGDLPGAFDMAATMPGHQMRETRARALRGAGDRYLVDLPLPMPGRWEIALRPAGRDETAMVRFVAQGGAGYIPAYRFVPRAAVVDSGAIARTAAGVLCVLAGGWIIWAGQARRWPALSSLAGLALTLVGAGGFLALTYVRAYPTTYVANPVPNTPAAVTAGAALFAEACADCHGPSGRGEDQLAASLERLPDLADPHMESHRDGDLYWWISRGVPRTKMPSFADALTEEQIWQIVRFLRTLPSKERRSRAVRLHGTRQYANQSPARR